jgi:hypothetical protein
MPSGSERLDALWDALVGAFPGVVLELGMVVCNVVDLDAGDVWADSQVSIR